MTNLGYGNKASIVFHAKTAFREVNRVVCFAKKIGPRQR